MSIADPAVVAALVDLGGRQRLIEWGWFRLTSANAVVLIALCILLGAAAVGRLAPTERDAEEVVGDD